jgi:hypothetical protein
MKKKRGRKAQLKLSFGMIFSVILIVIFIAFAFYAIQKFLNIERAIQVGQFVDDLQSDIDKMWKSSQGSQETEYFLPSKVGYVCFVDYFSNKKGTNQEFYSKLKQVYNEYENLIFYPVGSAQGLDAVEIKNINIEKITENENPFCIENIKGKVEMIIKKEYGEALVMIER